MFVTQNPVIFSESLVVPVQSRVEALCVLSAFDRTVK